MVTVFAGLVVNALLARLLTPEAMGAYFLTFSVVMVSAMLAQLGLNQTVVRLVAESLGVGKPGRARAVVRKAFLYGTVGALVVAVLLSIGVGRWLALKAFDSSLMAAVIGLAALWVVVMTLQGLLAESFRGFHDIRLATIFGGLVTSVLSAALFAGLWIIQGHSQLGQVLVLCILAGSTSAVIAGVVLWNSVKDLKGQSELKNGEILTIAWPILVSQLTFFILTQADIWIVGIFRTKEEVAIYGAAVRLVALVAMPLVIVNAVVPPMIAEMYAQGKRRELEQALRTTATLAGIPAFLVLFVFICFGRPLLGTVFGTFYSNGAMVLSILSLGQLAKLSMGSCGLLLNMTGHQYPAMIIAACCSFVMIAVALASVSSLGITGVAIASASGLALQGLVTAAAGSRLTGIKSYVLFSTRMKSPLSQRHGE